MARVTVEDCLQHVDTLFELVLISSKRSRQIYMGSDPKVPVDGDKPTVVALREVAEGLTTRDILDEEISVEADFIAEAEAELAAAAANADAPSNVEGISAQDMKDTDAALAAALSALSNDAGATKE